MNRQEALLDLRTCRVEYTLQIILKLTLLGNARISIRNISKGEGDTKMKAFNYSSLEAEETIRIVHRGPRNPGFTKEF